MKAVRSAIVLGLLLGASQTFAASAGIEGGVSGYANGDFANVSGGFGGNVSASGIFGGFAQVNTTGFVQGTSFGPWSSVTAYTGGTGYANTGLGYNSSSATSSAGISLSGSGFGEASSWTNASALGGLSFPVPPVPPVLPPAPPAP